MTADRLPLMAIDTVPLARERQFEAWAGHSRNTLLSPVHAGGFLARGQVWDLGPVLVSAMELDPFVSDRDAHLLATDPADHVQIVVLQDGALHFAAEGIDQECVAPEVFVRDYARTSRVTTTRIACITIYMLRAFLQEACGRIVAHGRLPSTPETAVLGATATTIVQHLPDASAGAAPFYADALRNVAAAALLRTGRRSLPAEEADRLARAKALIARQPPGSVSIDALVRDLGVSRSVLYEMFGEEGGVIAYDRMRRLRALYRDLAEPGQAGSIAEIGARHGFLDRSALTRSFRNAFGCAPSDVRRLARQRAEQPAATGAAAAVRHKIAMLR